MEVLGGFLGLVARRLVRRSDRGPRWARRMLFGGLVVALGAGLGLALGQRGVVVVGSLWVASVAALLGLLVVRLRPMLVVAVFGLALGVAALFVVLGVASGIERSLIDSLARLNGHAMVSKYGLDFYEYEEVAAKLEADPRVEATLPFVFGVGALVVLDGERGRADPSASGPTIVSIKGVDPKGMAAFSGAAGLLSRGDLDALRPAGPRTMPGIVLGHRLAARVDARIGDRVRIVVPASIRGDEAEREGPEPPPHHGEFEVLGLLDTGFAEFDASFVLVHLTGAQALVYGKSRVSGIEVELRDPQLATLMATATSLADALNAPRLAANQLPLYRAASWAQRSATLTSIRQTKAALVLILSLIVLVSSGSLMGALLLLLRRERQNIGMLAAIGAKPRQLFALFELVGLGIGLAGSGLGLALGGLSLAALALVRPRLDPSIYMVDHLPVAFVLSDVLVPAAIAVVVCGLATGPIAAKVARTKPMALLG